MKINVGDYVRYVRGAINGYVPPRIGKVKEIDNVSGYLITLKQKQVIMKNDVIKSSSNIIDLIEVGDYVNGSKLLSIDYAEDKYGDCDKLHFYYSFENTDKDVNEYYEKLIIKSILTKEQFESMSYEVE